MNWQKIIWLKLRLAMGFVFLWAFLDKTFGFGFATAKENAWINGGSPTTGFLTHAVRGPFADFFRSLAGVSFVDWLFMAGLLFVGIALIFNKRMVLACVAGSIMLFLMWLALLWPENNPFVDEHIVYILVLFALASRHNST